MNTAAISDFRKKWITLENGRLALGAAMIAVLVSAVVDDVAEFFKGEDVCGTMKDDFAAVTTAIAELPEMQALAGREVEFTLNFDVPKEETGGIFAGSTCFYHDAFHP